MPTDRYEHLRALAAAQKTATVARLRAALETLRETGCAVSASTIQAVGGPSYVVIRRNPEAYALYVQQSAYHTGCPSVQGGGAGGKGFATGLHDAGLSEGSRHAHRDGTHARRGGQDPAGAGAPDPLLTRKRYTLARALRAAWTERDEAIARRAESEDRYQRLLAEHQQCGEMIARLQAALVNDEFRRRIVDFQALERP
jgi:hypothetical protein